MQPAQKRPFPSLSQLTLGVLILGGALAAGLVWSMFR